MSTLCQFVRESNGCRCTVCGRFIVLDRCDRLQGVCRGPDAEHGFGDYVARKLARMGVTEERYVELKSRFGLPPTCGCRKRREWLNRVGEWFKGTTDG